MINLCDVCFSGVGECHPVSIAVRCDQCGEVMSTTKLYRIDPRFDYVEVQDVVVDYIDKEGRQGKPTGMKITGAAEVIVGGEYLVPNVAILEFQENREKAPYPFQTNPVDDVQGHDKPVIFHLAVTWERYEAIVAMLSV